MMKINELLEILNQDIVSRNQITNHDLTIKNITTNLQKATSNDVVFYKVQNNEKSLEDFFARLKGRTPALIILNYGSQESIKNDNTIFVDEGRFLYLQKVILDKLFPNKNTLKLIGVTGTNGKTTTVNLAMQISTALGHKAFSVGTIGVQDENGSIFDDLESTTPSYIDIRKIIHATQDKYHACFIEVSSHALAQQRLFDLLLDGAAWTSFSQDHLDYHKTMEEYFESKMLIEKKYLKENVSLVVPEREVALREAILKNHPNAKIQVATTLVQRGLKDLPLFYHSDYNKSNIEIAYQLNEDLWGINPLPKVGLDKIETPKGRFSIIELGEGAMVIVDYAHTPDALTNIGGALKSAFPKHKITVVFGCGGNRDKTKRPLMAKAVERFANKVIVTSDNPRNEAPEDIILDTIKGLAGSYEAMVDRKQAIEYALDECEENEIILIAGKGHEEYQEIKGVKHPFSDFNIVKDYIAEE